MSETILTTGERMKASMAYKAFERAPGEYFVTRLSNGRHAGVVAGPFATPQEAWAEVDRRWAADRDAAITNDGVTTAARAAFRASKDAGNDDECASLEFQIRRRLDVAIVVPFAFAAIGDDGRRPVVWGVGDTEEEALEDARGELREADTTSDLRTVAITAERRAEIEAGDVDAEGL